MQVSVTAYTGIAATLLHRGQTVHSYFKLPVPVVDGSTCNISPTSPRAQDIANTSLFIINEELMIPKHALDAIDILLRDIHLYHKTMFFSVERFFFLVEISAKYYQWFPGPNQQRWLKIPSRKPKFSQVSENSIWWKTWELTKINMNLQNGY